MKARVIALAAVLLGGPAFLTACSDSEAGYRAQEDDYTYEQRESFRAKMESTIDALEARLSQLKAKAAAGGEKVKAETQELLDELEPKVHELRARLAKLGDATRESWNDFERGFREAVADVERKLEDAFD
jgi:peptidoglycan hydrolase CwlO-like protein